MGRIAYMNGDYIDEGEIKISPLDRGFLLADSVFEVTRTFAHKPFELEAHILRLYKSLRAVRIDLKMTPEMLKDITLKILGKNLHLIGEHDEYWLVHAVTRGVHESMGGKLLGNGRPTCIVYCQPIPFELFGKHYSTGIDARISSIRKVPSECIDARIKTYNRLNFVLADLDVKQHNSSCYALLLDTKGNLTEGTGYNVFLVSAGKLLTPRDEILLGITRKVVIELAQGIDIPVIEGMLRPYDLYNADEAFIATTSRVILPIATVDGIRITEKIPGPVTERLLNAFSEKVGIDIVHQAERHLR